MEHVEMFSTINKLFDVIERLIPFYMEIPEERTVANGNVAACIIDDRGLVHGKMFGTNNVRLRQSYHVAWTKASQVWLTGIRTGEYEKMFFNKEVDIKLSGIQVPDLIGWEGGQPLTLKNGIKLSVGFSGFRGVTDLEIMIKALAAVEDDL